MITLDIMDGYPRKLNNNLQHKQPSGENVPSMVELPDSLIIADIANQRSEILRKNGSSQCSNGLLSRFSLFLSKALQSLKS